MPAMIGARPRFCNVALDRSRSGTIEKSSHLYCDWIYRHNGRALAARIGEFIYSADISARLASR